MSDLSEGSNKKTKKARKVKKARKERAKRTAKSASSKRAIGTKPRVLRSVISSTEKNIAIEYPNGTTIGIHVELAKPKRG